MGLHLSSVMILVVYVVLIAVIAFTVYLVVRSGVRDALRGHQLWLERTNRIASPGRRDAAD